MGTSGFVVAISFAPSADSRDSSMVKKSSGNSVSSSQYAPPRVMPRILLSERASFAPSSMIFRPNKTPSFVESEKVKLFSPISSCSGSKQLRLSVCRDFAHII